MTSQLPQLETPVALFAFNRPEPTRAVFSAIRAARPQRLLVIADGPRAERGPSEVAACAEVRAILEQVDWPCQVSRLYADDNLGCGARVSSGLDWVFDAVAEAIVLEDDCVPEPDFFAFCAAMLHRYRDDDRVSMVAGTNYLSEPDRVEDYFFARYYPIWGWAAWRRSWRAYDVRMRDWPALRATGAVHRIYADPGLADVVSSMFDELDRGSVDTWDIQWFFACLFNTTLCVSPRVNLVRNLGFDGTRPPGPFQDMATYPLDAGALRHPRLLVPDFAHERRLYAEVLRSPVPDWRTRCLNRLPQRLSGAVRRAAQAVGRPIR